ncbi:hypothetical protein J6590_095007 [Homalodisca vitripennis]|nr:hypothetical protein J6590_095397 [Homalodisca vitripennis]KAG8310171.1 hypothetical protein J6590_068857 [Homalodisca vitripennis]KAG8314555.1 hypothetical protein J6590_090510 [Homalodisca vitripennis]KAG8319292.1 hypothetical protein J6590_095007 [Homalodisca vitripennis]
MTREGNDITYAACGHVVIGSQLVSGFNTIAETDVVRCTSKQVLELAAMANSRKPSWRICLITFSYLESLTNTLLVLKQKSGEDVKNALV